MQYTTKSMINARIAELQTPPKISPVLYQTNAWKMPGDIGSPE
jgi:hypothetical protein